MKRQDRELGMDRDITRRDFLSGVSMAIGASILPVASSAQEIGAQDLPGYYPPELTGMRGSHPGSFETGIWHAMAHRLTAKIRESATISSLSVAVSAVCPRHIFTSNQWETTPGY